MSEPSAIPEDYGPHIPLSARAPNLNAYNITKALRSSLQENFGDAIAGAFSGPLNCKYYSPKSGICIVRCAREGVRYVWGAITLLHTIDGKRVRICVRACGGKYAMIAYRRNNPQSTEEGHCYSSKLYHSVGDSQSKIPENFGLNDRQTFNGTHLTQRC